MHIEKFSKIFSAFFRIFFSESISNRLWRLELSSEAFFLRICFFYGIEKLFIFIRLLVLFIFVIMYLYLDGYFNYMN